MNNNNKLGIYFLKRRETEFERKTNNPKKMIDTWTFKMLMKKKHETSLIIYSGLKI